MLENVMRRWLVPAPAQGGASHNDALAEEKKAPFSIVVPTVYGQMIVNRNDINQTNALLKTGRAIDHEEIVLLSRILSMLGSGLTVIDIGANFGTYSLGLAPYVGERGKVHAFEPQRIIFNMLAGSVALNALTNVYCHNMAVGEEEGSVEIPQFDYSKPLNFGSIEFGPEQREALTQAREYDAARAEHVPLTTVDRFNFERVDLMKIDAEGMELEVLRGAMETIRRCRPVMYVEFVKVDQNMLRQRIGEFDYVIHPIGMNFLCIPSELTSRITFLAG